MTELEVRLHVGQGTHRGPLTVSPCGPMPLGHRMRSGGRIGVESLRWHDRTVHLPAVDLAFQGA